MLIPPRRALPLLVLAAASLVSIASGCGGSAAALAPPQPASPAPPAAREEASTAEDALAAIDRAEHTLDDVLRNGAPGGALSQKAAPSKGGAAPPPPPPPPAAPPAATAAPTAPAPADATLDRAKDADKKEVRLSSDPCSFACAALVSMQRAATHLCDLAGSSDARCASALARVSRASERVRAACPSCG